MEFKVGDKVVVTGDSAGWGHLFPPGTVGTIVRKYRPHSEVDDYGWRVKAEAKYTGSDSWNVATVDLKSAYPPVTDEEMAEVRRLLGVES